MKNKAITHSGSFHADDVFASVVVKTLGYEIGRSRDAAVIAAADIAFDVGGGKYDHHQRGDREKRENDVPFSSFGKIFRDFGRDFLRAIGVQHVEIVFSKLDSGIVTAIDAVDNGVTIPESASRYCGISLAISNFSPTWDEAATQDERFLEAMDFAEGFLIREAKYFDSVAKTEAAVQEALDSREDPRIIVLTTALPWAESIQKLDVDGEVLYVIFQGSDGIMIQAVAKALGSFESRQPLPESWAGLKDAELSAVTGVEGAVFCHPGRFIAGATSVKGAIEMAMKALGA